MRKSGRGVWTVICAIAAVLIGGGIVPEGAWAVTWELMDPKGDERAGQEGFATAQGAATYSIPIAVPPGRGGMKPSLTLVYNSDHREPSILGAGWSLAGLASVERRGANWNGVPKYDGNDTFVLNFGGGSHKLVYAGVDPSGQTGNYYRTQIESFLRIRQYTEGSIIFWEITDKRGVRYDFRFWVEAVVGTSSRGQSVWYVQQATDPHGNHWYATYARSSDTDEVKPYEVRYSGPVLSENIKVSFQYEARPDVSTSYRLGHKLVTDERLVSITVTMRGALVSRYNISYTQSPDTQRSLVSQVQQAGADVTTTLPPVRFSYSTASKVWYRGHDLPSILLGWGWNYGTWAVDVNRDGRTDIVKTTYGASESPDTVSVWVDTGSGWVIEQNFTASLRSLYFNASTWTYAWQVIDIDGDGLPDLIPCEVPGSSSFGDTYYRNTGTGWSTATWGSRSLFCWGGNRMADVNGDGLVDIVRASSRGPADPSITKEVYLNTGSGWSLDSGWSNAIPTIFSNLWLPYGLGGYPGWRFSNTGVIMADVTATAWPISSAPTRTATTRDASTSTRSISTPGRGGSYLPSGALLWSEGAETDATTSMGSSPSPSTVRAGQPAFSLWT